MASSGPPRPESVYRLDDRQFEALSALLTPPASRFWTLERLLTLLQTVALVCTACWALYVYLSYEREARRLELAQKRTESRLEGAGRLKLETDKLSLLPLDKKHGLYQATLEYAVTNMSKSDLEVSLIWLRVFKGTAKESILEAAELNSPGEDGIVTWRPVASTISLCPSGCSASPPELRSMSSELSREAPTIGGATGRLKAGESSYGEHRFLIRAKEDEHLSFVLKIFVDQGKKDEAHAWQFEWQRYLREASIQDGAAISRPD